MADSQGVSHGQAPAFSREVYDRMYEELYRDEHGPAQTAAWYERIYADETPAEPAPSFFDDVYAGPSEPVVNEGPLDLARRADHETPAPKKSRKAPVKRRATAAKKPAKRVAKKTHH